MTRNFTCRGFPGAVSQDQFSGHWHADISVAGCYVTGKGSSVAAAKANARSKLDSLRSALSVTRKPLAKETT